MTPGLSILIKRLATAAVGRPLAGFDVAGQFRPGDRSATGALRNLNAAFLLSLADADPPGAQAAGAWRASLSDVPFADEVLRFHRLLREGIAGEWAGAAGRIRADAVESAVRWCRERPHAAWNAEAQRAVWSVFFPEGVPGLVDPDGVVERLRRHRTVRIERLAPDPIRRPAREVLFTANVLIGGPHAPADLERLPLSRALRRRIEEAARGPQAYWYDHPIPLGAPPEANEVVYGLRGLDAAVAFEKGRGRADPEDRLAVALSVSVTHPALQGVVGDYLRETLAAAPPTPHLAVYAFSEADTTRLVDEVLEPAARSWRDAPDVEALRAVFGVDGEYGRHYSFLKAVAALWQVLIDPAVRGTFKIDLDQVFPQRELVEQGGGSAFDHLCTPLWGAEGRDDEGRPVDLGMLAGALVNERDLPRGLFTPDVPRPEAIPAGEATVFFNRLPMALSTEAEMMTRYGVGGLDGRARGLQRYHVTGGTSGIRIDRLRRHRPFTPTFIGRAEDQAYLLSTLFEGGRHLRCAHAAGLIMRHDKQAFAGRAIEAARAGRFAGDLARTLHFSDYAAAQPWGVEAIKRETDPFTGSFISPIPVTLVALRHALAAAERFEGGGDEACREAAEHIALSARRLAPLLDERSRDPGWLGRRFAFEREGWSLYHGLLDAIENARRGGPGLPAAAACAEAARGIVESCRVR